VRTQDRLGSGTGHPACRLTRAGWRRSLVAAHRCPPVADSGSCGRGHSGRWARTGALRAAAESGDPSSSAGVHLVAAGSDDLSRRPDAARHQHRWCLPGLPGRRRGLLCRPCSGRQDDRQLRSARPGRPAVDRQSAWAARRIRRAAEAACPERLTGCHRRERGLAPQRLAPVHRSVLAPVVPGPCLVLALRAERRTARPRGQVTQEQVTLERHSGAAPVVLARQARSQSGSLRVDALAPPRAFRAPRPAAHLSRRWRRSARPRRRRHQGSRRSGTSPPVPARS